MIAERMHPAKTVNFFMVLQSPRHNSFIAAPLFLTMTSISIRLKLDNLCNFNYLLADCNQLVYHCNQAFEGQLKEKTERLKSVELVFIFLEINNNKLIRKQNTHKTKKQSYTHIHIDRYHTLCGGCTYKGGISLNTGNKFRHVTSLLKQIWRPPQQLGLTDRNIQNIQNGDIFMYKKRVKDNILHFRKFSDTQHSLKS